MSDWRISSRMTFWCFCSIFPKAQKSFFSSFFCFLGVAEALLGVSVVFLSGACGAGVLGVVVAGVLLDVEVVGLSFEVGDRPSAVEYFDGGCRLFQCDGMICMGSEKTFVSALYVPLRER